MTSFYSEPYPNNTSSLLDIDKLLISSGTLTTSNPSRLSQTWNNAGVGFEGLVIDITNTASIAATSFPFVIKSSGVAVFAFDISGSMLTAGSVDITNKIFGYKIEENTVLSANHAYGALAVGSPTASAWMVGLTASSNTIAVGLGSIGLNTTGTNNVAVGAYALGSNTTGHDNAAVGNYAAYHNTTGFYNTAIGGGSVFNNTTGLEIIGVGFNAAAGNVGGSFNIGVGNASLNLSQNDTHNVGIGHHSMYVLNGGSYNVGVGNNTLAFATTGANNVAVGYNAGSSVTTGSNSIFIGLNSGYAITTGNTNILIGEQTGANGITTGSNNVIIGSNVTGLAAGLTGAIILATGDGNIKVDYAKTTASTWTFSGAIVTNSTITVGDATALVKSSVAMNDGAGAGAGTLNNAPAAGNPTKWIPINDNGTTRYIPAW